MGTSELMYEEQLKDLKGPCDCESRAREMERQRAMFSGGQHNFDEANTKKVIEFFGSYPLARCTSCQKTFNINERRLHDYGKPSN